MGLPYSPLGKKFPRFPKNGENSQASNPTEFPRLYSGGWQQDEKSDTIHVLQCLCLSMSREWTLIPFVVYKGGQARVYFLLCCLINQDPGINKLLQTVHLFCTDLRLKLVVEKTVILSSGLIGGCWVVSRDEPTLEASLIAKYLELDLSKAIKARMISTA